MSAKPGFAALQQAANWYARLTDAVPDDEQYQLWQQWLAESDEHRHAWHYVENVSQRFRPLRENVQPRPVAEVLLRPQAAAEPGRRRALKLAALLTTGTLLAWATWRHTPAGDQLLALSADYQSKTGEVKALTLSDGTHVWLNTASALNADYSAGQRRLRLLLGEALIETAADPLRTFFIDSPQGQMQALGTRFSVRLLPALTRLVVYEGAVEVTPAAGDPLRVPAGSQLFFGRDGAQSPTPSFSQDADWRQGMLRADNLRLDDFIHELARYRRGHLACDPAVADLRVMGTWPLHDTDRALAMLEQALPVSINRRFSWWVTVEQKKNKNL
ncbi:FecR family protein [Affinibrenneria salicis]|uniref:FecR family protein n=1 Tax=Affinibrenneria salicis TaxID=2590031 RepID=A0A5J5FW79_9GAMM|nr:FecR family protein [Affinibrenneria salicis]KAA8998065.1 FecR family protein [Affinibrenneria salicis]